ncbi:MAG: pantoate--beta-alanine ligase [Ignavibacteriales bacterium]|nr:pantoate--beta-alanine ligase [Ignavibacteriales bacterium]
MITVTRIAELRKYITAKKQAGMTVGLVPTMGFLHKGHIALVQSARKQNDVVVVSIFVNPTQFAPNEDFNRYPRDIERDCKLLDKAGADIVFIPEAGEIYPPYSQTFVSVETLSQLAEGEFRPTHFRGVATIVNMLFNIVQPGRAYFGQKDAQQTAVIRRMVKDLHQPVDIIICPIVRETDGLAMSSRNIFLSEHDRKNALTLSKSLELAKTLIGVGERTVSTIISAMTNLYRDLPDVQLDYIRIVDAETFLPVSALALPREYFIIIACKVGSTRLIDNVWITVELHTVRFQ